MNTKYTPGPWEISHLNQSVIHAHFLAKDKQGRTVHVAQTLPDYGGMSYEEQSANAKLIAAAPDLLKAVEKFVEAIEDEEGTFDSCVGLAKDAYNKATGAKLTYHRPIISDAIKLANAAPELLGKLVLMVKALETEGGYEVYHNDLKEAKELCNKIAPETFIIY